MRTGEWVAARTELWAIQIVQSNKLGEWEQVVPGEEPNGPVTDQSNF